MSALDHEKEDIGTFEANTPKEGGWDKDWDNEEDDWADDDDEDWDLEDDENWDDDWDTDNDDWDDDSDEWDDDEDDEDDEWEDETAKEDVLAAIKLMNL